MLSVFCVFSNASILFGYIQVVIFLTDLLLFYVYDLKVVFTIGLH